MREFKFRAWDSDFKTMIYGFSEGYQVSMDYGTLKVGSNDGNGDYFNLDLMQYTGLKDKNGTEIYEGDLLKFFDKVIAVVVFQDLGGWSYKWIDETYVRVRQRNPEPFFHNIMLLEVAGNIYETPNLLK